MHSGALKMEGVCHWVLETCSQRQCFHLQHVASNIVEHEIRHKEILQSSFDLLGELIKFNWEAFKTFDSVLTPASASKDTSSSSRGASSSSSSSAKFEKFTNTVNRNMVDSNMFIRSLVLSLEHFRSEGKDTGRKFCALAPVVK